MLRALEAACEQAGSIVKQHYSRMKGTVRAAQLVARVHFQHAHVSCLGHPRDDLLIADVVIVLREVLGQRALF